MLGRQHHLDRRIVANVHRPALRQRDLWETKGPRVGHVGRPGDLEGLDHGVAHVGRDGAQAHVHVDKRGFVAGEPGRLDGDGASLDGPFGSVGGRGHATTWFIRLEPFSFSFSY